MCGAGGSSSGMEFQDNGAAGDVNQTMDMARAFLHPTPTEMSLMNLTCWTWWMKLRSTKLSDLLPLNTLSLILQGTLCKHVFFCIRLSLHSFYHYTSLWKCLSLRLSEENYPELTSEGEINTLPEHQHVSPEMVLLGHQQRVPRNPFNPICA